MEKVRKAAEQGKHGGGQYRTHIELDHMLVGEVQEVGAEYTLVAKVVRLGFYREESEPGVDERPQSDETLLVSGGTGELEARVCPGYQRNDEFIAHKNTSCTIGSKINHG